MTVPVSGEVSLSGSEGALRKRAVGAGGLCLTVDQHAADGSARVHPIWQAKTGVV